MVDESKPVRPAHEQQPVAIKAFALPEEEDPPKE